jgi:hypothetical protein
MVNSNNYILMNHSIIKTVILIMSRNRFIKITSFRRFPILLSAKEVFDIHGQTYHRFKKPHQRTGAANTKKYYIYRLNINNMKKSVNTNSREGWGNNLTRNNLIKL